MLIIILLICLALFISGILVFILTANGEYNPYSYIGIVIGGLGTLICIFTIISGVISISKDKIIDEKITMYLEENTKIETSITETVEKYLEHELNIFDNLEGEDIQTLLVAYPEINSNELVKKQVEIFVENNDKIKQLKEEKLNIKFWRFWVYFG